jgi:DNA polymerase-3 subunit gamma/tau
MRDAQSLLEQMIAFSGKDINDEDLLEVLGVIDRHAVQQVAVAILDSDPVRCLEIVERLYLHGHDLRRLCQELAEHFRNLLVIKVSEAPQKLVELTAAELTELREQADRASNATFQQFFHFLLKAEEDIRRSSNPKLVLEMTLLRLIQLPQVMDIHEIISQVQGMEQRLFTGSQSATKSVTRQQDFVQQEPPLEYSQTEEVKTTDPQNIAEPSSVEWQRLVERIRREKPVLAASLERVSVREVQPDGIELDFNGHEFDYELVKEKESFGLLNRLAQEIFGKRMKISLKAGGKEIHGQQRGRTKRQRLQQQKALKHPLVTEALEIFGGEIIDVKVRPDK